MAQPSRVGGTPWLVAVADLVPDDLFRVGAKNYGLHELARLGLATPLSFVLTTHAFERHLEDAGIDLGAVDEANAAAVRQRILDAPLARDTVHAVEEASESLFGNTGLGLAVRSSLYPFEDDPRHACAGLFVSRLNLRSLSAALAAVKECYASLLRDSTISYFARHRLDLRGARMAVGIQETIDAVASATLFTEDPVTLNPRLLYVDAADGFGGVTNAALVETDGFFVDKRSPGRVIARRKGTKRKRLLPSEGGGLTLTLNTSMGFALDDATLLAIARDALRIEEARGGPQDIELAVARGGRIVYLQTRAQQRPPARGLTSTVVDVSDSTRLASGAAVVFGAATAPLKVHHDTSRNADAIIVSDALAVRDVPKMYGARGLVVRHLPPTSHPAIHMRELGVPTLAVGDAIHGLASLAGRDVTLDASSEHGALYEGALPITQRTVSIDVLERSASGIHLLTAFPTPSWTSYLRESAVEGVHVRGESIHNDDIRTHPLALLAYDDDALGGGERYLVERRIVGYASGAAFYVAKFSERLALIRSAMRPDQVISLRLTDLQTPDYKALIAGDDFEGTEANPCLGLRGAARLLHPKHERVLALELMALRDVMRIAEGRYRLVVPVVRDPEELVRIRELMRRIELDVPLGMMVETPAAVFLASRFAELCDFFCIGVGDLAQLVNGADRTHPDLSSFFTSVSAATGAAVEHFFRAVRGLRMEVHVPEPFYRFVIERPEMVGDCEIKRCVWPDGILRAVLADTEPREAAG